MTTPSTRDDRVTQEDRDSYSRAVQQADELRQEVATTEEAASAPQLPSANIKQRLDSITDLLVSLGTRVARLEANQPSGQTPPSTQTSSPQMAYPFLWCGVEHCQLIHLLQAPGSLFY